jgi:hypothetical protein
MTTSAAHLVFLPEPDAPRLFLWGPHYDSLALASAGRVERVRCLTDQQKLDEVAGVSLPLIEALPILAALSAHELERSSPSIATWSLAAKFALDLIARGRIVPRVEVSDGVAQARCGVSLAMPDDADRFTKLMKSFAPAAHALPVEGTHAARGRKGRRATGDSSAVRIWAPDAMLEKFLNAAADTIVRAGMHGRRVARSTPHDTWERRFLAALCGKDANLSAEGFAERSLFADLRQWIKPIVGAERGDARACFRFELPQVEDADVKAVFTLRFFLQSVSDPSLLIPAAEVYRGAASVRALTADVRSAQERLLTGLAVAGQLFPSIAESLRVPRPEQIELTPHVAAQFLDAAAAQLLSAGFGVVLPAELTRSGLRRLRMKMRLGTDSTGATDGAGAALLTLDSVLHFHWQAELAGETLDEHDLRELAKLKSPLVRYRGQWIAIDSAEIAEALRLLGRRQGTLVAHEALAASLGAMDRTGLTTLPVEIAVEGALADLVARLRSVGAGADVPTPAEFKGTLRPYQTRGLSWLATMADLGLGACLADDMGLGKTIQLIALLLQRRAGLTNPVLLVCPTSVVGNWERELQRFGPSLPLVRHYGAKRARSENAFANLAQGAIVLTTYGLLRRDAQALAAAQWSVAALDEAQNIKNASSKTAQAARALRAGFRVALTGTPVENHLAELWSIFEFLNPHLLGSHARFRREYAIPIERYGQADVAERLKAVVQPFILRRLKSDPSVIQDLPPKQEMKVICSLTREQASLYQAALDDTMRKIEAAEGIERRGLVLALITALKQICNHPAHYLGEAGPLAGRSGKLQRCVEMLEEVIAANDRALIFTQYREMGVRLVAEIERVFGIEAPFLHGGVARAARDEMVRRFQEDARAAPIFVLSVKAGGTGLNLTAASHVFHFDRWWNPAVEDQATDRAYRIGQQRTVQVHKLLCAGTVEEKVDRLLENKRDLASRIVGAGEQWITELNDSELRDLFSLGADAVIASDVADADDASERPRAKPRAKRKRARAMQ